MRDMMDNGRAARAVGFLLGLANEETVERVRARIDLPGAEHPEAIRQRLARPWLWAGRLPASVALWILEEDDPRLTSMVWRYLTDIGLRRAVCRGVPFGPGRTEPRPAPESLAGQEPEVPDSYVRHGLVGALRLATAMGTARAAASMVLTRDDWRTVAEADAERALPGYARWALSVRPDCPPTLRARFGSHPKFTHRLRQAGVFDSPADYALAEGPAVHVLDLLSLGHAAFPNRSRAAEDALRPLVRDHLGRREEAWAVLAQLVETFHGTTPELVMTAGAIA
ncbi:hypothetical protein C3489_33465 [Streptomyces sp. Ru71]|uniref:hypothetical protein n=1 Tax=Streptomyces sp. Ru71 TaxID=2080746 RepID=UPI000CDDE4EA|nr:hypothetical protein [Streptomyces sp. Ru71]POX45765.1 hypothetical protein C3489_33465 [Streptomyces sp. Ru71]